MTDEISIDDKIKKLIVDEIKNREEKIKKEDAEEIVKALIPEVEKIASAIIIKHLKALALYVETKLK